MSDSEFSAEEKERLSQFVTNVDEGIFALRNLPEEVKAALFSRYSRSEKSIKRILLDEFLGQAGVEDVPILKGVDKAAAQAFFERVLLAYGDDSVAELAGAHLALEGVSTLAAKALQDSRIGISPLEKSTRYVRFDRPGKDGNYLYYKGEELDTPLYREGMDQLFNTYVAMLEPLTESIRQSYPINPGESDRAWKTATRAKALDTLRGLLPAGLLTNVGLYGNGRAFEYLITKMAASPMPEMTNLATSMHRELGEVISVFVKRAYSTHGKTATDYKRTVESSLAHLATHTPQAHSLPSVRLIENESPQEAERKVIAAALFPYSNMPLLEMNASSINHDKVLDSMLGDRTNRRHKGTRALEHATYTFEIVANFASYRDLQRHRMLTQERQTLGCELGFDQPPLLEDYKMGDAFRIQEEKAAQNQFKLVQSVGPILAQYMVPMAYRVRWYVKANLKEVYHLCELRTAPQGHPDYRFIAQEMFKRVEEVHPRLARYAKFVDMSPGDELERRKSEQRIDEKLKSLGKDVDL